MQFTQIEFFLFLAFTLIAAWTSPSRRARNCILLILSYYFYAYWDYRFCALLILSTAVDFVAARQIARSTNQAVRNRWLYVSLGVNLGMLGFFKYCNFFIDSAAEVLRMIGWNPSNLNIILPVGISFFTFQTLSYTIDVYRKRIAPSKSLLDFALYVCFFPQLVAGPIVRATELLPQLANSPRWSTRRFYGGSQMVLRGLVKKVLVADRLGEFVDVVFAGPELYSSITVWICVVAYAGQIYYDFSGYTDIAIGVAKMLGYRFPRNFRHPYLAGSLSEFWQRWHMTLSRWLRDYLYIPLGGNRKGAGRTSFNLILTMALGGLWHGAAWTFVLWGLWHGVFLALERRFLGQGRHARWAVWLGHVMTVCVVGLGWVLFRSVSMDDAVTILGRMFWPSNGIVWHPPLVMVAIAIMLAEHAAWMTRLRGAMRLPYDRWYSPIITVIGVWCLLLYTPQGFSPFVYFQF